MARIAVLGMSSFGYYLARELSRLGSEVLAVDKDDRMVDRIKHQVSRAVIADIMDKNVMSELYLRGMDTVVLSLGSNLEASIIAAMHLKEAGVERIVAKALTEDHAKILEKIGVSRIVFPERDIGVRLAASLHGSNVMDFLPLGSNLSIIEISPLKEMVGRTPEELEFRKNYRCQILAVRDKVPEDVTFIPKPDLPLKASHILIVMGENKDLDKLQKT